MKTTQYAKIKFKSHINEIIQLSRMLMRLFLQENVCIELFIKSNSHLKKPIQNRFE